MSLECTIKVMDMEKIIQNYKNLSEERKNPMLNESLNIAIQYLEAKPNLIAQLHYRKSESHLES